MGRKKKRNRTVKTEVRPNSQPKSSLPPTHTIVPAQALPRSTAQWSTYILCVIMFAAGILAQKTFDRWKVRQELAMKNSRPYIQGRGADARSKF